MAIAVKQKEPSFWGDINKFPKETPIKNELIYQNKVYTHDELEQKINQLLWAIESSDYQKAIFLEDYMKLRELWEKEFDFEKYTDVLKIEQSMIDSKIINHDDSEFIELRLDFILPYYSKNVTNRTMYYARLKKSYQQPIISKIRNLSAKIDFKEEKCFVLISQYMPNFIIRDLDNRFHSIVFNALRSANIIKDDDWQNLSYMENGYRSPSKKGFTNILIGSEKSLPEMLRYNDLLSH